MIRLVLYALALIVGPELVYPDAATEAVRLTMEDQGLRP